MSNEVSIHLKYSAKVGNASIIKDSGVMLQDHYAQYAENYSGIKSINQFGYQTITDEALYNPGHLYIKNIGSRDATTQFSSPILIGVWDDPTFTEFATILPNEALFIRASDVNYRVISEDGEALMEYLWCEDNRLDYGDNLNPDEDDYFSSSSSSSEEYSSSSSSSSSEEYSSSSSSSSSS